MYGGVLFAVLFVLGRTAGVSVPGIEAVLGVGREDTGFPEGRFDITYFSLYNLLTLFKKAYPKKKCLKHLF